jgi:hypothetical protein
MSSGLVLDPRIKWARIPPTACQSKYTTLNPYQVSFHSYYDFGYLLRICTGHTRLPALSDALWHVTCALQACHCPLLTPSSSTSCTGQRFGAKHETPNP